MCGGLVLAGGEIERVTEYETGLAGHHSTSNGVLVADPLILDERYLAAEVAGRGVTILSACSHAGVVNACLDAESGFRSCVDVVLGGYHLAGPGMEDRIGDTVRDLVMLIEPASSPPATAPAGERKQPSPNVSATVGTDPRWWACPTCSRPSTAESVPPDLADQLSKRTIRPGP